MFAPSDAEELFFAALERTDPQERTSFLDEACAGNPALRARVERLLAAQGRSGDALERGPAKDFADAARAAAGDEFGDTEAERAAGRPRTGLPTPDFLGPTSRPDSLGRLGHYEVLGVIGQGGMGMVLKAFDEKLHRVVAIKALARELAAAGTARQRFVREARAAAAVSHENVVTIHAVEADHRPPYLVMQYVEGRSLQDRLDERGPPDLEAILRIGLQTAQGLAAAHRQGLVHRDVKPANILLENGVERVKLTDFGLARAADDASLTQSGHIVGTPLYMSPEQAVGESVDPRSDQFSLGSVLYAMCTGHPPFRAGGTHAVLRRVAEEPARPMRESNHAIPDWLCEIVARLHAKNPAERYPNVQTVAEILERRLAELHGQTRETTPPESAREGSSPAPARISGGTALRRRRLAWCAVALGVVAASSLAWRVGFFRSSAPEQRAEAPAGVDAPRARDTARGSDPNPADAEPLRPDAIEELSRLVAFDEARVEIVRKSYAVGRVPVIEVNEAEARLLEGKIKLHEAGKKSIVPLLEELERLREDDLGYVELRFDAGAAAEGEVAAAKRRVVEVRARLAAARATEGSRASFLLKGGPHGLERFETLAQAIAAALDFDRRAGGRGGSNFVTPLVVNQPLVIRA
ncbi:MAG TPA: serine/threonine-protein kinase, partial [Planctomycetia bacterium]|nr:serine/threonine-protein kinase [Planctomycetia bacterium]